jgi:hypothetical protein
MRFLNTTLQLLAVIAIISGAAIALTAANTAKNDGPIDTALDKGSGTLDGLTFTTMLSPEGKPDGIRDAMFFRDGQFLSLECEDRCNYPPSAYFARAVENGHEFYIEAWCPTKDATMVWRGRIEGDKVSGTVKWSVRRFYWTTGTVLEFSGSKATEEQVASWRP